jgi:hypothetical protein
VKEYHEKIKKPMSLDKIRRKLDINNISHYDSLQEVVSDIRLIFKNAYIFNPVSFNTSICVGAWYFQHKSLAFSLPPLSPVDAKLLPVSTFSNC